MYNFIMLLALLLITFIPFIIKLWFKYKDKKYLVVLSIVLFVIGLAKLSNYSNVNVNSTLQQSYCALLVMFICPTLPWLVCISNNEKFHMRIAYYMIFEVLLLSYYFAYIM